MKIRNDFVTNSSSVSYIITMNLNIVESFEEFFSSSKRKEIKRITEYLKNNLIENGTRVYLGGEEIIYKKVEFRTDEDTIDKCSLESEVGEEINFEDMDDDKLLSYIYGEFVQTGKLGSIQGFGSTMVKTY